MRHALPIHILTHAFSACSNKLNTLRLRSKKLSAKVAIASLVVSQFTATGFAVLQPTPAFAAIQSCNSPDARMKVDITDMIATRQETILPQVHLGSSTVIPDNTFFSIRSGGTNQTDSTIRMDVPGLSAQRGNGWIKFLIESKGTPGRKGFTGNISIEGARFYGIATEGRPNKVERPFNGKERLGRITQDEIAIENDNLTSFTLTVGPRTDSFTLYYEPVNCPIVQNADISFQKIGPASVNRGENISYDFIVRNLTGVQANAITIIDTVPAGLTYSSALSEIKQCTQQGQTLTCGPLGNILPNATNQGKVVFTTSSTMNCGTITNTARVTTSTQESSTTNNQSSYQTTINCPTPTPQCKDGIDNDNDGAIDLGDFSCSNGDDNDETNPKAQCQDGIDNDSDGKIDFPQDPGCTSKQDNDEFNGAPDLSIQKSGPVSTTRGQNMTYTLTVTNNGTSSATNGEIIDPVPSTAMSLVSSTGSNCTVVSSQVHCPLPVIAVGASHTVTLTFYTATVAGCTTKTVSNTASVSIAGEINTGNNTSQTVTTTVYCDVPTPTPQCKDGIDNDKDGAIDHPADFSCSSPDDNDETNPKSQCQDGIDNDSDGKVDFGSDPGCSSKQDNDEFNAVSGGPELHVTKNGPATVNKNGTITYTVFVENKGTQPSYDTVLVDNFPADVLTYIPSQSTPGCTLYPTYVHCIIGDFGPGETRSFSFTFSVKSAAACNTSFQNKADIQARAGVFAWSMVQTTVNCPQTTQCSDSVDNDSDGKIDYPQDPGCSSAQDTDEYNAPTPQPQCNDGVDNDSDGKIDYPQDPGCSSLTDNDEYNAPTPTPQCSDSVDNDSDGKIDYPQDPGCSSAQDNDETNAPPTTGAKLEVTKTGPTTIAKSGTIAYQILATNSGYAPAQGTVVADHFPIGQLEFLPALSTPGCTLQSTFVLCIVGEFSSQQSKSFTLAFKVKDAVQCNASILNKVDVQASGGLSAWDDALTTVSCGGGLDIEKTGPATVTAGNQITYNFVIKNNGSSTANNVIISDFYINNAGDPLYTPPFTYISASGATCAYNNGNVACSFGNMTAGQTKNFSLTFQTPANQYCGQVIMNQSDIAEQGKNSVAWSKHPVTVQCPSVPLAQCKDGIDNDADGKIDFPADPGCSNTDDNDETNSPTGAPDLRIDKNGPANVNSNGTITYQILASNYGAGAAQGVVMADYFPVGHMLFVPGQSTPGCRLETGHVLCEIGEFASSQSRSFTLTFTLTPACGCGNILDNKASLQAAGGITVSDSVQTSVTCGY